LTGALSGTSATGSSGVTFGANNRGFLREPAGDVEIGGAAGAALKLYSNGVEYAKIAPSTGFTTTLPFGGTSATFSGVITGNNDVNLTNSAYVYSSAGGSGVRSGIFLNGASQAINLFTAGSSKLSIDSTGTATFSGSATFGSDVFTYANGGIFFNGGGSYGSGIFQQSGGNLILQTGTTPRLTIVSTGAATFSSSVSGTSIRSSAMGSFGFNTANNGEFQIYATATDGMIMAGRGSSNDMVITNKNGNDVFRIPSGTTTTNLVGDLGVGTATPSGKIHAVGINASSSNNVIYLENSVATILFRIRNDGAFFTGTGSSSPYNNTSGSAANLIVTSAGSLERSTSSLKYKTDVRNYDKGLEDVMKIRPVYYHSKNEREKGIQFAGLIAEEIHELGLTEFVQYAEDGTPDALAYQNMIALAFKAIQEQQAQIEELKAKIVSL
jgi:hypothetical protein